MLAYFCQQYFSVIGKISDAMWGQPLLTRFTALYICAANIVESGRAVASTPVLKQQQAPGGQAERSGDAPTGCPVFMSRICSTGVKCGEPRQ